MGLRMPDYLGVKSVPGTGPSRRRYFSLFIESMEQVDEELYEIEGRLFTSREKCEIEGLMGPDCVDIYVNTINGVDTGSLSIEYHGSARGNIVSGNCLTKDLLNGDVLSDVPFSMDKYVELSLN